MLTQYDLPVNQAYLPFNSQDLIINSLGQLLHISLEISDKNLMLVFSLSACWIMCRCYREKLHVNHFNLYLSPVLTSWLPLDPCPQLLVKGLLLCPLLFRHLSLSMVRNYFSCLSWSLYFFMLQREFICIIHQPGGLYWEKNKRK